MIRLHASSEHGFLKIRIENPFDESEAMNGTGFGLSSVKRRLFLLYGRTDLLSEIKSDEQFIIELKLPQVHD